MTILPAQCEASTSPTPAIFFGWRHFFPKMARCLPFLLGLLFVWPSMLAENMTVLHNFTGSPDGEIPWYGTLVRDSAGNLYGTTLYGGAHGQGTVFKISGETETVLHSFYGPTDGGLPLGGLFLDAHGSLYGTTSGGGSYDTGTVFKLTDTGTYTVLHNFRGYASPAGGLVMDSKGNLYGTTQYGGTPACNCGVVFKLTPKGTYTVLHGFAGGEDGKLPVATMLIDKSGNLYGTTLGGGSGYGTVFEVNAAGEEKVLYRFQGGKTDGETPYGSLAMDTSGNLYGTTYMGMGSMYGAGTAFMLRASTGWLEETILHAFNGIYDGRYPAGSLVLDHDGNAFGTTQEGGLNGRGIVFKIASNGVYSVLCDLTQGIYPLSGLVLDSDGNLYGTTEGGGSDGAGTVFEIR